jgi:hypothetical protein
MVLPGLPEPAARLFAELGAILSEEEAAIVANYNGDLSDPAYQQLVRMTRKRRREITAEAERIAAKLPPARLQWQERHPCYRNHPLAELFPLLSQIDFAKLCVDIRENGLIHPIVLDDDLVIDGRNRLLACTEIKIDPHFIEFGSLGLKCSVETYIWSTNVERRHLTADQRAALAVAWQKRPTAAAAKERQRQAGGDKSPETPAKSAFGEIAKSAPVHTREALATAAKVTPGRIRAAEEVQRRRPDLIPAVVAGEITLSAAQHQAQPRATKSPEKIDYLLVVDQAAKAIRKLITDALSHVHPDVEALFWEEIGKRMTAIVQGYKRPGAPGVIEIAPEGAPTGKAKKNPAAKGK